MASRPNTNMEKIRTRLSNEYSYAVELEAVSNQQEFTVALAAALDGFRENCPVGIPHLHVLDEYNLHFTGRDEWIDAGYPSGTRVYCNPYIHQNDIPFLWGRVLKARRGIEQMAGFFGMLPKQHGRGELHEFLHGSPEERRGMFHLAGENNGKEK